MTSRPRTAPVVGIVGHDVVVPRPWGDWPVTAAARGYGTALAAVGLRWVVLPGSGAGGLLDLVDALLLTGGGDLDPRRSGAADASDVDPARDEAELALVPAARAAGIPVLGVCRGLQVLVVADGGTLRHGVEHVRPAEGHVVHTAPGSMVRQVLGPRIRTSALHHQAVADTGSRWRATAWSGGVVEAVEPTGDGWAALGVQWHPELEGLGGPAGTDGTPVFEWLAAAARRRTGHSPTASPPDRRRHAARRAKIPEEFYSSA